MNRSCRSHTVSFIVVTAPNSSVCSIYQKQLSYMLKELPTLRSLRECRALCVSDPLGTRIGSGGGTLNAINHLINKFGKAAVMSAKIIVIHSGGDSRRSPLNSVSGKAWSSINSSCAISNMEGSPIVLLIRELVPILDRIQVGTVVVASTDVLVNLTPTQVVFPFYSSVALL